MKSINKNSENLYEINKSKFYTFLIKINNIDDIKEKLNKIEKKYNDATHYCYAYIINGLEKCSDDGEPSKTAGAPILNVLKHNNLDYILCVVVRYFGGIKLGAGGLVRAYSKSVTECLKNTSIIELDTYLEIKIDFDYNNTKQIDYILNEYNIINKEYDELIAYTFVVKEKDENNIHNLLDKYINNYKIIKKVLN